MSTKILIRDLRLEMLIGIHDHEKETPQPVLINIEACIDYKAGSDSIDNTLCYDTLIKKIQALAQNHVNLVETLAENIAGMVLENGMVKEAMVRVEKTAIYDCARSVGVEIHRRRTGY